MSSKNCRIRRKNASIALEAALVMPIVLLVTAQWISLVLLVNLDMTIQGALDKTAAELSLLSPLCALLETMPGCTAENSATELPVGQEDAVASELTGAGSGELLAALQAIWPGQSLGPVLADAALDLASSALLGQFLQYRLDYWLQDTGVNDGEGWSSLRNRRLFLDWQLDRRCLWLCLSYQVQTPLCRIKRQATAVVPLWLGFSQPVAGESDDDIWQQDNFSRGQLLRTRFGGNLPYDFPVIASFSGGEALMIKSADLTAPTYQDQETVRSLFAAQVQALSRFENANYIRDDFSLQITPQMIAKRRLLVIIPENCSQSWLDELIGDMQAMASQAAVGLDVVRFGRSSRYLLPG